MTLINNIPQDHKDCPYCKELRSGLTWTGNPFDPDNWPRCPYHRDNGFSHVYQDNEDFRNMTVLCRPKHRYEQGTGIHR